MNKIVELAIKNANDKLAKKQAGDRLKAAIDVIKNGAKNIWNNPNFKRNAGNAIVAGGLSTGTYFGSRALGNDKKTAAKHSALMGGGYLGGKTLYDYKDQLKNKLVGLFGNKQSAPVAEKKPNNKPAETKTTENKNAGGGAINAITAPGKALTKGINKANAFVTKFNQNAAEESRKQQALDEMQKQVPGLNDSYPALDEYKMKQDAKINKMLSEYGS